jgi:hypothetical protein
MTTIPFSRFGRWTNHLTTQQLTQTLVPANHRSAFAGAEMGLVSLFGLGHWVVTALWNQHGQFRWLRGKQGEEENSLLTTSSKGPHLKYIELNRRFIFTFTNDYIRSAARVKTSIPVLLN